jgi:hypothetical protein
MTKSTSASSEFFSPRKKISLCHDESIAMLLTLRGIAICLVATSMLSMPRAVQPQTTSTDDRGHPPVVLSDQHTAAVNRPRRIMVNNDVGYPLQSFEVAPDQWVEARFSLFDEPGSQVDCISWCLDEGNYACYPSKVLPEVRYPGLQKWLAAGVDIAKVMADETHKRGLEAFWEYRLNGADREADLTTPARLPMKEQHPDWLLKDSWWSPAFWNFAIPQVRNYKVAILREVAENYGYDGITIDFGRHPPCLPVGEQWLHREAMTDFVRKVRLMLQEVAQARGRPFLLAVRVAATPAGCHYDGLDVEAWVHGNLIDIIIMGVRSTEVAVGGFRRITAGTHIKLYPSIDDVHSTDGYHRPPIEFFRGLAANWRHQGVDGIVTFNFANESPAMAQLLGISAYHRENFAPHRQAYHEIGDADQIRFKDKVFVLQRRYGAGWGKGIGTDKWGFYQNMNHEAPLPLVLPADGSPIIEPIYVGDEIAAAPDRVKGSELRILLGGAIAESSLEAKFNGVFVKSAGSQESGWRVFELSPHVFACGRNLASVRLVGNAEQANEPVRIEKLEIHVDYEEYRTHLNLK